MYLCILFECENNEKKKLKTQNVSPIPLTCIAILPINFYDGYVVMDKIHKIVTLLRFIEHGTFILLSFILFDDHDNSNIQDIFAFKIYICVTFVIAFGLYYYIVVYLHAIRYDPTSTNRTLKQLLELQMCHEIVEMHVFGSKYSDEDWRKVMKDKTVENRNIVTTWSAFLSRGVIDVENILSSIESVIDAQDVFGHTVLHCAASDRYASVECISELLKCKANTNVNDSDGDTPLHWAVRYSSGTNRLAKLSSLLDAGADVNAKEYDSGRTALHFATFDISRHDCIDVLLGVSNVIAMRIK